MMRFLFEKKPGVILLSILALGALIVLSVSLRDVTFMDAQPIGREEAEPFSFPSSDSEDSPFGEISLQTQVVVLIAFAILIVLIGILLSPEARKRVLRMLVRLGFTIWALYFIMNRYPEILTVFNLGLNRTAPAASTQGALADIPPPVFTPPQDSPLFSYFISLIIVFGFLFLAWRLSRTWSVASPPVSLKEIANVARSSLRELSFGRETTDVIMNCYFRMSDVVSDRKHLQRGVGMTPGEFASRLEESGLPGDAVKRLTRLFESARYGNKRSGAKDVDEAVTCLTTILQYCGETI